MSTRATVWIRNDEEDISVFLYHHCDGYSLDEDIDPVLKNLPDDAWNVVDIQDAIQALEFGDSYRRVDTVGWASEYVYKISIDERKMYKYNTGIGDPYGEANFESRLTDLERTYEYQPEKWEGEPKEGLSPLAAKLKEIVNSYDEDHSMTNEGAEFYANQLRPLLEEKKEPEAKVENEKRFSPATVAQILQIQLIELVKYACKWLDLGAIPNKEVDRIQKLFKTLNEE